MAFYPAWGGGGGGSGAETTLWTNANPTSNYTSGTETLSQSMGNFTYLKIVYRQSTTDSDEMATLVPVSNLGNADARISISWNVSSTIWSRNIAKVSDTSVSIGISYKQAGANQGNANVIPLSIIGVK